MTDWEKLFDECDEGYKYRLGIINDLKASIDKNIGKLTDDQIITLTNWFSEKK